MKVIATLTEEEKKMVNDAFDKETSARLGAEDLSRKAHEYQKIGWQTIKEAYPDIDGTKMQLHYNRETGEVRSLYDK